MSVGSEKHPGKAVRRGSHSTQHSRVLIEHRLLRSRRWRGKWDSPVLWRGRGGHAHREGPTELTRIRDDPHAPRKVDAMVR